MRQGKAIDTIDLSLRSMNALDTYGNNMIPPLERAKEGQYPHLRHHYALLNLDVVTPSLGGHH